MGCEERAVSLCDLCGRAVCELTESAVECEELGKTEKAWWHPYEGGLPADVCPAFFERLGGRCPVCGRALDWDRGARGRRPLPIAPCRACGGTGRIEERFGHVRVACGCGAQGAEYLSAKGGRRMAIESWNMANGPEGDDA